MPVNDFIIAPLRLTLSTLSSLAVQVDILYSPPLKAPTRPEKSHPNTARPGKINLPSNYFVVRQAGPDKPWQWKYCPLLDWRSGEYKDCRDNTCLPVWLLYKYWPKLESLYIRTIRLGGRLLGPEATNNNHSLLEWYIRWRKPNKFTFQINPTKNLPVCPTNGYSQFLFH